VIEGFHMRFALIVVVLGCVLRAPPTLAQAMARWLR
jgi:hypothetical protein